MSGNVLIYHHKLLGSSETFIYYPAMSLKRYTPIFVGARRVDGFTLPADRTETVFGNGRHGRYLSALCQRLFDHDGTPFLARKLAAYQPRLIQAHFGTSALNVLPLANRLNIPLIVYYHGYDATITREYALQARFTRRYLQRLPQLYTGARLILTQSDFLRDCLLEQGFPPEKVRTHYIGVEPPEQPPLPYDQREKIVLFVARLVEKKGAADLINAMHIVQQTHPDLKLVIAGSGDQRAGLEALATQHALNVDFVGWQNGEQVRDWMRKALIFSVPSVYAASGNAEGFGMVFIEAQREGTPVVSTQHGGIVESVADGVSGLLAPEHDPPALARHIIRLAEDRDLWQAMSQAGADRVARQFNRAQLVTDLEAIYDEILG